MKKIVFLLLVYSLTTACKKEKESETEPDVTTALTVVEFGSGLPVEDASITLLKCNTDSCFEIEAGLTDESGMCDVSETDFQSQVVKLAVSKENYWPFTPVYEKEKLVTLRSEGWLRLSLHSEVNKYPPGSVLRVSVRPKTRYNGEILDYSPSLEDSVVMVKGFGGEVNTVRLLVYDGLDFWEPIGGTTFNVEVPRFATLPLSVEY